MQNLFNKFSFIVAFMIFVTFFNMALGSKATEYLLILILMGMVVVNADAITGLFKNSLTLK